MKIIKFITKILVSLVIIEILIGYFGFHYVNYKYSKQFSSSLFRLPDFIYSVRLEEEKKITLEELKENLKLDIKNDINIFLEDTPKNIGYKYHPLIEFTNVHGKYKFKNDYFGFRNKNNIYFKKSNNLKIILTGGSECAGFGHEKTISEFLAKILRDNYQTENIDVINLCMNSYAISNEIQTFVHIGWNLNPDIVISHTGWNDALYSMFVPRNFIKHGIVYYIGQEQWKDLLYGNKVKFKDIEDKMIKNFDEELFFTVTKNNLEKYNKIVEAAGGQLLVGLQPFNEHHYKDKTKYQKISLLNMKAISNNLDQLKLNKINFDEYINEFEFIDNIHTNTKGAELTAKLYSEFIIRNFKDLIKTKLGMVNNTNNNE